MKKPAAKKPTRLPFAELRARQQLASRALDDARALLMGTAPDASPEERADREQKAIAIFEELTDLLPLRPALTDEERARMEKELEDKPDDETLRAVLREMEKMLDDPSLPEDLRAQIPKEQIHEALAALDEVALLAPIAAQVHALAEELRTPRKAADPKAEIVRREAEKQAAKRRS
jgi:hypothetical protein